jgi:hypothetical protein
MAAGLGMDDCISGMAALPLDERPLLNWNCALLIRRPPELP